MQATKKSNSVATSSFDTLSGVLSIQVLGAGDLSFSVRDFCGKVQLLDKETLEPVESYAFDMLNENGKRAVGHGMNQRLMDKAAIGRDSKSGKSATPQQKYEAIATLATHYANGGEWAMKGGGTRPLDRAALYQAVAVVRGTDASKVEAIYRSKEDVVLRTLLAIDAIAAEYARITAKGDSAKGNELLAELDLGVEQDDEAQPLEGPQGG